MNNKDSNFKQKVILLLIDKLAIAIVILIVGLFISMYLEEYKHDLKIDIDNLSREFVKQKDSLDKSYKEKREDLIRMEENKHKWRMEELRLQHRFELERVKTTNSMSKKWIEYSVDRISMSWKLVNKINLDSEILEDSVFFLNDQFEREIIELEKKYKGEREKLLTDIERKKKIVSSHTEETYKPRWKTGHLEPIDLSSFMRREDTLKLALLEIQKKELISEKQNTINTVILTYNSYQKIYQAKFQNRLSQEIENIEISIQEAIDSINVNRFWIGENQRKKLLSFLGSQQVFISELPKANTKAEIERLISTLNRKREDIYSFGNKIFNEMK